MNEDELSDWAADLHQQVERLSQDILARHRDLKPVIDAVRSASPIIREAQVAYGAGRYDLSDSMVHAAFTRISPALATWEMGDYTGAVAVLGKADPGDAAAAASHALADPEQVVAIDQVSRQIRRTALAGLTQVQSVIVILTWLLAIVAIAGSAVDAEAQGQSPAQPLIGNASGYVALALAITWRLRDKKDGS